MQDREEQQLADRTVSTTDGNSADGPVLIVGASVRSAAQSALRSGMRPIGADCFADQDLLAVADVLPMHNYPDDLPRLAADAPPGPWMYTGALENYPEIIAKISTDRPLWGNPAEVVRTVRDPFQLREVLQTAGLPTADLRCSAHPPEPNRRWMLKPIRGSAGRGIEIWDESSTRSPTLDEPHYFQQRLTGRPLSALFVATEDSCRLIGIARQFVGRVELHAPRFAFCGAIAPIDPGDAIRDNIRRHGEFLARCCELRGLFGIDFLCDDHQPRLTDVNPRYTATVELFEHAFGVPLLREHRRAFGDDGTAPAQPCDFPTRADHLVAKAILYADHDRAIPDTISALGTGRPADGSDPPIVADIPAFGTQIRAGHPICTLFAAGQTERECLRVLRHRVRTARQNLTGSITRP